MCDVAAKAAATAPPTRAAELLTICPVCGEIFDANRQFEVHHHASREHAPLLPRRHKAAHD